MENSVGSTFQESQTLWEWDGRVSGLLHLLAQLDTLLQRFLQSSPNDQDSDLGATGLLHKLALLDARLSKVGRSNNPIGNRLFPICLWE